VTGAAGTGLPGGLDATELRYDAIRSNRIEEEHFSEIALGLSGLETRVGRQRSLRQPRLGKVGVVRYHQLLNSADLLVDVLTQLPGASILSADGRA